MARPRKMPAVLVEATIRENGKLAALPSDTARLGYIYVCLGAAKLLKPTPGLFTSAHHFREVAGRFAKYLEAYLAVGLLEQVPRLCERCRDKWSKTPPTTGQIVVHDWHEHQYDPYQLERQRAYDARQRGQQFAAVSDAQSDAVSGPVSDAVSDADLTADSRGGARDRVPGARRTPNVERENESVPSTLGGARNGAEPLLSAKELDAWRPYGRRQWDGFKAAWLARGFKLPPAGDPDDPRSQAHVVWEILDNRPTDLVAWVKAAPGRTSHQVVAHLLERWQAIKAEAGVEDEPRAPEWLPSKGEAAEALGSIMGRLAGEKR